MNARTIIAVLSAIASHGPPAAGCHRSPAWRRSGGELSIARLRAEVPRAVGPTEDDHALPQPRGMTTFRSKHYQVTTDLDRAEAAEIARHMDRVFDEYNRRFASFGVKASKSFTLYLFRRQRDYVEYLEKDGVNAANTGGIFYIGPEGDGLASYLEGNGRAGLLRTLQHEGFHQFAWVRIGRNLPAWANEGLAEYFGYAYAAKTRFVLGRVEEVPLARLKRAIERDRTIPFGALLTMTDEQWSRRVTSDHEESGLQYAQSWSVVHFLIEGERGRHAGRFIEYLKGVSSGMQHEQAFAKAFGSTDYAPFEAAWKKHVLALEPDPMSTATGRLDILARALEGLHGAGRSPSTLDELRRALIDAGFTARRFSHAGIVEVKAQDPTLFETPPEKPGAPPGAPELLPSKKPELPPGLSAKVGRLTATVVWKRDKAGELSYEIEID